MECCLVAWRFSGVPDQYCKGTLYFCNLQGGDPDPPAPPPLDPHMTMGQPKFIVSYQKEESISTYNVHGYCFHHLGKSIVLCDEKSTRLLKMDILV